MTHAGCGGTILTGGSGDLTHRYCDRCGAFDYEDYGEAGFPAGKDVQANRANRAAWDNQDDRSPEAQS